MRRISFSMTKAQFLDGSKTVTRRLGWASLKVGTKLMGVEKAMGLRKGEKQVELGALEVVSVRRERLNMILVEKDGPAREGFPEISASDFIDMFCKAMKVGGADDVTRIEFRRCEVSSGS